MLSRNRSTSVAIIPCKEQKNKPLAITNKCKLKKAFLRACEFQVFYMTRSSFVIDFRFRIEERNSRPSISKKCKSPSYCLLVLICFLQKWTEKHFLMNKRMFWANFHRRTYEIFSKYFLPEKTASVVSIFSSPLSNSLRGV